nr:ABC transporter ATP-binding protein [bacterium]
MEEIILSLQNIQKSFDGQGVLHGIDVDIYRGEFVTLLGPSGCGKTTTLRIIAGLETPDEGRVLLNGADVTHLPPEKRNVNTVFQNYALFPHMNVQKNIAYGLKIRKAAREDIQRRVDAVLRQVQLEGFGKRMPSQLSGGQRQRVAIARAVVNNPDILLLDEPLGALDLQLRRQMQTELKSLQRELGITFIYITHDQEEALNMSNRIAVMNKGRFEQIGTPENIYEHPQSRYVAQFIGQANILEGVVEQSTNGCSLVKTQAGSMTVLGDFSVGEHVAVCVRAERIDYGDTAPEGFHLPGTISMHSYIGGVLRTLITLGSGQELLITGANPVSLYPAGSQVEVFWDPQVASVVERGAPHEA